MSTITESEQVIGNNAVYPGLINLNDNTEVAHNLFGMLNFIAEELDSLYSGLIPEDTQEHIKK
ncbi:hypothetical protein [Shewanella baltica]|uniref:hypothetical protein n=1 Tax=Shewanella baltica TaxID=62322 RepID=UPI00321812CE